ncbi:MULTISPECIES: hypothetical protein [Pseudoalteromonas]|jgi:hypothetical protein|uniref:hypothetical protein n=1 Tax=Pseudoalteromonas TaxID=53246 RepID=UPI00020A0BAB|nr:MULTISPECIES: hypothetical protein [Pseudoalteromonas]EGI72858.1 hypothetical protein PH505_bb00060 [Pseudoalteromonas distincta]MBB1307278.1 hypothetical protein [Pseudoalteromonas sp. SR43-5]
MSAFYTFLSGAGYNLFLAIMAYVLLRVALRYFNRRAGYTLDDLVRDCKHAKDYRSLAILYGLQLIGAALLFGLVIS